MVVSRGLCINRLPRFGNPPELVIVRLEPLGKGREGEGDG